MDRPRDLARLEQQEHPAREVAARVGVETDVANQCFDLERDAEHALRSRLPAAASELPFGERHGACHAVVVAAERTRYENGPVVVASLGQLATGPRAEDDDRHVGREIAARQGAGLRRQLRRRVLRRRVKVGEANAGGGLRARERSARIVYEGGGASSIHGTSRQRARRGANDVSSSGRNGTWL
jgi:hypothetical protein